MIDIRVLRQDPQRVRDNMTVNRHIYRQIEPGVFAYIRGYMAASKQVSYLALEHFDGNKMTASLDIPVFPVFIGCRQYDSAMYQARPLYALYSKARALKVTLTRDYQEDREHLELEDVQNEHGDQMPLDTVELVPQSLVEDGKYWLDKGEFRLSIHSNR